MRIIDLKLAHNIVSRINFDFRISLRINEISQSHNFYSHTQRTEQVT